MMASQNWLSMEVYDPFETRVSIQVGMAVRIAYRVDLDSVEMIILILSLKTLSRHR